MAITIPRGMSVSLPVSVSDGPGPTLDTATPLTGVTGDDAAIRVVYPDPTPGIALPQRSIRVDAVGAIGAATNVHARYTSPLDGTIRNLSTVAAVAIPPNNGFALFGDPSDPFPTPV